MRIETFEISKTWDIKVTENYSDKYWIQRNHKKQNAKDFSMERSQMPNEKSDTRKIATPAWFSWYGST